MRKGKGKNKMDQFYLKWFNSSSITNPAYSLTTGNTHPNFIGVKF